MKTKNFNPPPRQFAGLSISLIAKTMASIVLVALVESCTYNDVTRVVVATRPKTEAGAIEDKLAEKFTGLLNTALQYQEVREFLKQEVAQKIDGDFDILYAAVKNKSIEIATNTGKQTRTFQDILLGGSATNGRTSASALSYADSLVSHFPLLQIAIPQTTKNSPLNWNAQETTPYVAFDLSNFDEATTKTIPAISPAGNRFLVDAKAVPNELYAVVGKNERLTLVKKNQATLRAQSFGPCDTVVFEDEQYLYIVMPFSCDSGGGYGGGSGTTASCRQFGLNEFLTQINIPNLPDVEPWLKGAPEIQLQIKTANASGAVLDIFGSGIMSPDRADIDNAWWNLEDIDLFQWSANVSTSAVLYKWTEIDGGDLIAVTINFVPAGTGLTIGLKFNIGDGDDDCGYRVLQITECGTEHSTGSLKWRSRY